MILLLTVLTLLTALNLQSLDRDHTAINHQPLALPQSPPLAVTEHPLFTHATPPSPTPSEVAATILNNPKIDRMVKETAKLRRKEYSDSESYDNYCCGCCSL